MSASSDYLNAVTRLTQERGAAQARATEQNGALFGGAVSKIGDYIQQIPQQRAELARIKNQAAVTDLERQKLTTEQQQMQRAVEGQQTANQVIAGLPRNADGTYDTGALLQKLSAGNVPLDLQQHLSSTVDGLNKTIISFGKSKVDHAADLANSMLIAHTNGEPVTWDAVHFGIAAAKAAGLANDDDESAFAKLQASGADPEQVLKQIRGTSEKYKKSTEPIKLGNNEQIRDPTTFAVLAENKPAPAKPKTWAEMGLDAQDPKSPTQTASQAALDAHEKVKTRNIVPGSFEYYVIKKYGPEATPDQVLAARGAYGRADDHVAGAQAADITKLTPAGVDIAALNYRKTGTMPPLGMGDRTTRQQIINRAAQLTPEDITRIEAGGGDLAGNKAHYRADSSSLTKLQGQADAINAFENTARKNIDLFLETAKKVTDTGIPLLNTPARWIAGAGGSADLAKYNAARQVAISEIAKIVQNPNLTGQLSDSARHEIEVFNPANATLKQTVAVMNLLKQDMANRKTSIDQQLKDTGGRIGGKDGQKPADTAAPVTGRVGPYTYTVVNP